MSEMTIGALSAATGVKIPTIRYYESIGLSPPPPRTEGNRRLYDERAAQRLRFIRHARELGFEVEAIRQLLALSDDPDRSCREIDYLARLHLADIDSKIARLQALRSEVAGMLDHCPERQVRTCRVVEVLGNHARCLHETH